MCPSIAQLRRYMPYTEKIPADNLAVPHHVEISNWLINLNVS